MAVREIKTRLTLDNTKQFDKEIKEAGRNFRVLASDMKAAAADFESSGDEMAYLGQKSKILGGQIAQQEEIVRALSEAVEASALAFGDAGEKTDGYRIKLNNAKAALAKLKKELSDTDREMRDIGQDAGRVGRQLEQGLGEAAEDTGKKLDRMVQQLDQDLVDIKGAVEFSAITDVGDTLKGGVDLVVDAVGGLTEGTLDYRRKMAALTQNAMDAGFDPEWLKEQATWIAAFTGDLDGAVEAVSNMALIAPDVNSFTTVMNRLLGATTKWGGTFKIENLAESLQESLASGEITGAYSELMSRLGMDIETINKSIKKAAKEGSDAVWTAGTAWTSEHGFEETLEQYAEMNKDIIAYNTAKTELTKAEAELADKLTPAATAGIEMFTGMIDSITDMIEAYEEWHAKFIGTSEENKTIAEQATKEAEKFSSVMDFTKVIEEARNNGEYIKAREYSKLRREYIEQSDQAFFEALEAELNENAPQTALEDMFSEEAMQGVEEAAGTAAEGVAKAYGDAFAAQEEYVKTQAKTLWQAIADNMSVPIQAPKVTWQTTLGQQIAAAGVNYANGNNNANVDVTLDGKKVGGGMIEYNSKELGRSVERAEMLVE